MVAKAARVLDAETKMRTLEIPADESQLSKVRDFIMEVCSNANFSSREINNTKLAVDEACTNIIKHAYTSSDGQIRIKAIVRPGWVDISIFDTGEKFDFAGVKDPDLEQYVESGRKGGLGIFLINRLMDSVDYRSTETGNQLTLTKKSHSALARAMPGRISWRSSLKFKFTLRAGAGLFLLISLITAFTLVHQTRSIQEQKATQWLECRRLAENLSNKSKDLLLRPDQFSVEQTNLSSYLSKLVERNHDLSYVKVVDMDGKILSSSKIMDDIFSQYVEPPGEVLLDEKGKVVWKRIDVGNRFVRDINFPVSMRDEESGRLLVLGNVHLGIFEDMVESSVKDPRATTVLILISVFLLGMVLIMFLVSIFVRPIQVLTDGVRAIGQGSLEGKISVDGPAEIGAIASVFNEITRKFKMAQDSILEQEKLQKEMEVAKEIQHSLLPKKMPNVSGYDISTYYQAAAEVGGDYYDFVQVDEDTVGVVVADVSGKGVPGSLVMTMIRTALRMEARGNKNASDVMARMNEFVTDDMKKGMFVTMFYVILDSKNRIISYASAGHNPMILYRHETNETYFLNPKGFPVGISLPDETLFRKSINVEKIKLKKDDMLLIYTDGVTEAMDEKREQYGEERLLKVIKKHANLHPKEFIANLEKDIKEFTGGTLQNDDITIVAVKEKLAADDVLYGIRKRLIDMVEVEGCSVREACAMMKVSPATYYRYRKRLELMGERGLKNKVLREDLELKRVSLEDRKKILEIIRKHPEYGAKRIALEFNEKSDPSKHLKEKIVYDELKRLNLNTKELRLDYLKRYRLTSEEAEQVGREAAKKRIVEDFLEEVSKGELQDISDGEGLSGDGELAHKGASYSGKIVDFDAAEEVDVEAEKVNGDVVVLHVRGHLDSVSAGGFEKNFLKVIGSGEYKIVVDLTDVAYISSGGWGIFTGEVRKLRENRGDVVLVGMSPEVYDVFALLGFAEILASFQSVEEALEYFAVSPEERLTLRSNATAEIARFSAIPDEKMDAIENEVIPGESYVHDWESLRIEAGTVGDKGDIAVLSLKGIIDTVSSESLTEAIDRIISQGLNKIVVDMSQVEYVSSGGWGTFTERLREVRRNGGDIKLFGMDPDVYYVFTMLGFNIVLASFDILSEAIEDFSQLTKPDKTSSIRKQEENASSRLSHVEEEPEMDLDGIVKSQSDSKKERGEKLMLWDEPEIGVLVALFRGAIEASVIDDIDKEIGRYLDQSIRLLIFDLSGVSYISSSGWGIFAKYHERCMEFECEVAFSSMNESLYEIYSCLEFHSFIKAYPSVEDAISAKYSSEKKDQQVSRSNESKERDRAQKEALREQDAGSEEGEFPLIDDIDAILSTEEGGDGSADLKRQDLKEEDQKEKPEEGILDLRDHDEEQREEKGIRISGGPLDEEGKSEWRTGTDFAPITEPGELDLNKAEKDSKIDEDKRLRQMGWEDYGKRLKRKVKRKPSDNSEEQEEE